MKVYIRSRASCFIDGPPPLFVSKFLLGAELYALAIQMAKERRTIFY